MVVGKSKVPWTQRTELPKGKPWEPAGWAEFTKGIWGNRQGEQGDLGKTAG